MLSARHCTEEQTGHTTLFSVQDTPPCGSRASRGWSKTAAPWACTRVFLRAQGARLMDQRVSLPALSSFAFLAPQPPFLVPFPYFPYFFKVWFIPALAWALACPPLFLLAFFHLLPRSCPNGDGLQHGEASPHCRQQESEYRTRKERNQLMPWNPMHFQTCF